MLAGRGREAAKIDSEAEVEDNVTYLNSKMEASKPAGVLEMPGLSVTWLAVEVGGLELNAVARDDNAVARDDEVAGDDNAVARDNAEPNSLNSKMDGLNAKAGEDTPGLSNSKMARLDAEAGPDKVF